VSATAFTDRPSLVAARRPGDPATPTIDEGLHSASYDALTAARPVWAGLKGRAGLSGGLGARKAQKTAADKRQVNPCHSSYLPVVTVMKPTTIEFAVQHQAESVKLAG
jgi:hypothetical protein